MGEEGQPGRRRRRRMRHPTITDRMLQILLILYDNTGETRNTDTLIRWAIAAVMFPLNSAMLLFALPLSLRGEPAGLFIASAELCFVAQWLLLELRMQGLIRYWLSCMLLIESLLHPLRRVFGGNEYQREVENQKLRAHRVLLSTIILFGVLGLGVVILYAYAPIKKPLYSLPAPSIEEVVRQEFQKLDSVGNLVQELQQARQRLEEMERKQAELQKQINLLQKPVPTKKPPKPKIGERR